MVYNEEEKLDFIKNLINFEKRKKNMLTGMEIGGIIVSSTTKQHKKQHIMNLEN